MIKEKPKVIYLKDYCPPDFTVISIDLDFVLAEDKTLVTSEMKLKRRGQHNRPLVLYGEKMRLISIKLNNKMLKQNDYQLDEEKLILPQLIDEFSLNIVVEIKPQENIALVGLYKSKDVFCTQCESHGFRQITYYPDRPDVLSRFTTTITADKRKYPYLLANGNLTAHKDVVGGQHQVKWQDPSLKPAYLFALVAGQFDVVEDEFITMTNRKIVLKIFVEKGKAGQAEYAMGALKRAMLWDEQAFGLEYDLDIYMIVAVSDFNFGAMENKGLNIFNDKYVLADQQTATDTDFIKIESVIGHEYFHNWSGNRVTVRDWFQITLKEGLTIFRNQNFSQDMQSAVVERIRDVNIIRTDQFAQDASPMAHPIRPDHYIEVNNFYTVTVYNKGAEVIRMLQTILGKPIFRKGMDIYFSRYDGQAVTTEEFIQAMEEASGIDLQQFRRWYTQAGTPVLTITDDFTAGIYTLTVKQFCPPTPDQPKKENFHIPLTIGLLDKQGKELPLISADQHICEHQPGVLSIKETEQKFRFQIAEKPIPSLLRNFSAPVKIKYHYTLDDLLLLLKYDSDGFNRWDAGQKLATNIILNLVADYQQRKSMNLPQELIAAWEYILNDTKLDHALRAEMLELPSEAYLLELMEVADVDAVHAALLFVKKQLAGKLREQFQEHYKQYSVSHFDLSAKAMGKRKFKNFCLVYLCARDEPQAIDLAYQQFESADNMTDRMAALVALNDSASVRRGEALAKFYLAYQHEPLVINKWFYLQAVTNLPNRIEHVQELMQHPAFDIKNPNKVRALISSFCHFNHLQFHHLSGKGYQFLTQQILDIDSFNPQLAARLMEPLINWRKFDERRQQLMRQQIEKIVAVSKLSKDVYEVASRSL